MSTNSLNAITPPGAAIRAALKERGVSQKEFAKVVGMSASHLSEIINGGRKITISFAETVEDFLGISSRMLLDVQLAYDIIRVSSEKDLANNAASDLLLAEIDKIVNVSVLLKGITKGKKTSWEKLEILKTRYGIENPSHLNESFGYLANRCFRKSAKTGLNERMIATWVVKARTEALLNTPPHCFDYNFENKVCQKVVKILHANEGNTKAKIRSTLNEYGIGFCEVSKMDHASIDGYSFINNGTPYIVITGRYDRIDNLAFTVMHELGHIFLGHTNETDHQLNIDTRSFSEDDESPQEVLADNFASNWLIPNECWKIAPTVTMNPAIIQKKYSTWAAKNNLNKWIVLGRLSYETGIYRFKSDESRFIRKEKGGEP